MRARVVLFGAGASSGSPGILPAPPPLGGQLFGVLKRTFPRTWGALPAEYAKSFARDFEAGMNRVWKQRSTWAGPLMIDMSGYFAQFGPITPGATLYGSLVRRLDRAGSLNDVVLSTLNYELILELELAGYGRPLAYADVRAATPAIPLLKLHGSCHFVIDPGAVRVAPGGAVSYSSGATFNGPVIALNTQHDVYTYLANNGLPPVMCMYMNEKRVQVAPATIKAIQSEWAQAVDRAEVVAVVGVHPNPGDRHLWDVLAATKAQLVYIGDRSAFQTWATAHRGRRRRRVLATCFDAGLDRLEDWLTR